MQERSIENIVIGSGAAGLATALRLWDLGEHDTAIVTENMNAGTSRNTGSDKQTYYKLSLAGGDPDSVGAMAEDLFAGGAVDGDTALCEAALSARGFFNLVELGVPFPCNEYSEFMGYKTDHDRGRRATSAGPYTSKLMTQALERAVRGRGIEILDGLQAIRLLCADGQVRGVLCLKRGELGHGSADSMYSADDTGNTYSTDRDTEGSSPYVLLWARNVVLATGGPAGMYRDSVYPQSQLGGSGMAFAAGAAGKNLTEWQFGLASTAPRWNVSGTYMQVLPRFYSTDRNGGDEREFLSEYFADEGEMLSMTFLKGYQWPFDVNKIFGGSSVIDLLVYRETILRGRRAFLDFRKNPGNRPIPFDRLSEEARTYLERAGALFGTPIERLAHMNQPAIDFYADHHVNLHTQPLEIAICAQHNNGGLAADADWETCIRGLYAVGEVNGSHGVTRPGGSALNAGQVGAVRAAQAIHLRKLQEKPAVDTTTDSSDDKIREKAPCNDSQAKEALAEATTETGHRNSLRAEAAYFAQMPARARGSRRAADLWKELAADMSAAGGMIRDRQAITAALAQTEGYLTHFEETLQRPTEGELPLFYRVYDMLLSRRMYLRAMQDYAEHGAGSRGSALYTDPNGQMPGSSNAQGEPLPEIFRCTLDRGAHSGMIQEIRCAEDGDPLDGNRIDGKRIVGKLTATWRPVRPIPQPDDFFENQWRAYRERNRI